MLNPYPTIEGNDLTLYGKVRRTHGYQGELLVALSSPTYEEILPEFLFPVIDEIPIPYRVEQVRGSAEQLIIKLQELHNLCEAEPFVGCDLMILKEELPMGEAPDISKLIGYSLLHDNGEVIGEIVAIDSTTTNILLLVDLAKNNKQVPIPLTSEWLIELDEESRKLTLNFPMELLVL